MNSFSFKVIAAIAGIMMFTGCGSARQTTITDDSDEETLTAGYGGVSRKANAFSASEVESIETDANFSNIYDYLRNKVPGVYVSQSSDGGTPSIEVRGQKSIFDSNEPLILLDGAEWPDVSTIRPEDIHSVRVLKGAAASEYGSRGGNGVIMFKTIFAHETEMREAEARKAEKQAKKAARKK